MLGEGKKGAKKHGWLLCIKGHSGKRLLSRGIDKTVNGDLLRATLFLRVEGADGGVYLVVRTQEFREARNRIVPADRRDKFTAECNPSPCVAKRRLSLSLPHLLPLSLSFFLPFFLSLSSG